MSSSNKRYYWLKLKEDFFEDDTIQWLEEQDNGKDYVIFYLKLALRSLNDDGKLIRYVGETLIPYDVKALAKLTNTPTDTVVVALELFSTIGLISRLDSGEIYMNQIDEMVGSETLAAEKMRRLRAKGNDQKRIEITPSNNVTECYPELLEIEKDKELDKEKDKELGVKKEKEYSMDLKEKKKKEVKHKYGEFDNVLLTDVEYNKLQERFPHDLKSRIERLSGYVASTGKSYKSHYATVINWAKKDKPEDSRSVSVLDKIKQME